MRKLILTIAAIVIAGTLFTEQTVAQTGIVTNPDTPAIFPGGPFAMNEFIANSVRYPDDAFASRAEGLVVFAFIVDTDGTLSNYRMLRTAHPSLDAEALRILQSMPRWQPATRGGVAVRTEVTVPFAFFINPNATTNQPVVQQYDFAKTDLSIMENYAVFTIVDRPPQFVTGQNGLEAFLARNICYPRESLADGIEGRVLASFIVAPDGSISNIEIVNGINHELNTEAIRVLSMMPDWTPGSRNGVLVHVRMLQAVTFEIDEAPIPTGF